MADSFGCSAGGLDQAVLLGSQQQLQERGVVVAGSPHRWHHRNTLGENSLRVWASVGDLQQYLVRRQNRLKSRDPFWLSTADLTFSS